MSGESGGTGVGPAVLSLVTGQVKRFLPRLRVGNLDDRDPDAIREMLPGMWLLITAWFRPDVRGLHHIPAKGPALIVGNHTGGILSPEVLISQLAVTSYFGAQRPFYQLAHRMVLNSPLAPMLRKFGTVEADPDRLAQVFRNLVGNAVAHTAVDGLIAVAATAEGEVIRFDITDDGPGFSAAEAGRLFDRFYRTESSRSQGGSGSGLGLAIARSIVEAHGGRIWAEAGGEEGGGRVSFELPGYLAG